MASHPNNIPKANGHRPGPLFVELPPLGYCTACVADRKMAAARGMPLQDLPEPGIAICLVGGTGSCEGHIVIQQQSPLAGANGQPISRLLGPNGTQMGQG